MTKTQAEHLAQLWFYSCGAPDSSKVAQEISRLAKMIIDFEDGIKIPWKIVNRNLTIESLKDN